MGIDSNVSYITVFTDNYITKNTCKIDVANMFYLVKSS